MSRKRRRKEGDVPQTAICDVCGNDIAVEATICPFCDTRREATSVSRSSAHAPRIKGLNLKHDMPTGEQALERLDSGIVAAKSAGTRVLRVVHGYGSSGRGGVIKELVRQHLTALCSQGRISFFVPGEMFTVSSEAGDRLLSSEPALKRSFQHDRCNPGITFVKL